MMPTYTIQCFIETLSSDNKITLRGSDGYRLQKEDNKYLVFFENSSNVTNCKIVSETNEITIQQPSTEIHNMLIAAQTSHKKVELEINLPDDNSTKSITRIKLLQ